MMLREIIDTLNGTTRRRNHVHVAVGTVVGVLVGAAAGILFAPKSGKETRKAIKNVAEIGVENIGQAAQKAVKFVKKEAKVVQKKVQEIKAQSKQAAEIVADAAEDVAEEMKAKA